MKPLDIFVKIASILQSLIVAVMAIFIFAAITKPESILNKKNTVEGISRERAKLFMDLLKEEDIDKVKFGYSIIKYSYYLDIDTLWFKEFDNLFNQWIAIKEDEKMLIDFNKQLQTKMSLANSIKNFGGIVGKNYLLENTALEIDPKTLVKINSVMKSNDNKVIKYNNSSELARRNLDMFLNKNIKKNKFGVKVQPK